MLQNISEEIRGLEAERTELGLHIEQTEAWTQHLGRWGQWLDIIYLTILITQCQFLGLVKLVLLDGGSGYRSQVWAGPGMAAVCRSPWWSTV